MNADQFKIAVPRTLRAALQARKENEAKEHAAHLARLAEARERALEAISQLRSAEEVSINVDNLTNPEREALRDEIIAADTDSNGLIARISRFGDKSLLEISMAKTAEEDQDKEQSL